MFNTDKRRFKVILPRVKYSGQVGVLVGEIDYRGCRNGWHTLYFNGDPKQTAMFAGEEVSEIK